MNKKTPLRVTITPAYFLPLIYIPKSSIAYDFQATNSLKFAVDGAVEIYSAVALNPGGNNIVDFSGGVDSGGVDISVSAEYPLTPIVDVGVDIKHLPLVPSKLTHVIHGELNYPILDAHDLLSGGSFTMGNMKFSQGSESGVKKLVLRPLRVDFYTAWRPLKTDLLTLRPSAGFTAITPSGEAFFNGILLTEFNFGRIFFLRLSTGIEEGLWRHKLGFDLNFKVFELDVAVAVASQDYVQSYKASGAVVDLAIKFGW